MLSLPVVKSGLISGCGAGTEAVHALSPHEDHEGGRKRDSRITLGGEPSWKAARPHQAQRPEQ